MLGGHSVRTAAEMGWQDHSNGVLLALTSSEFDVVVTVDRAMTRQQNLGQLPLPLVVLCCRSNSVVAVAEHVPALLRLLGQTLQVRVHVLPEPERG